MNQNMGNRIAILRKNLGKTQAEFSERLGITNAAISAIELGKAPLTEANIRLICLTFGVNEEWLREGKGKMMDDEVQLSEREKRLLVLFRDLSPKARVMLIEYAEKLIADESSLRGEADTAQKGEKSA